MKTRRPLPHRLAMQGFTLVELIMVIVIVGILSAVALPRFFDLSGSARAASAQSLYAAVNSAMAIAHSAALIKGITTVASDTTNVKLDGNATATTMVYGYPEGSAAGIGSAINASSASVAYASGVATYTVGSCTFTYTQATSDTVPAVLTAPTSSTSC